MRQRSRMAGVASMRAAIPSTYAWCVGSGVPTMTKWTSSRTATIRSAASTKYSSPLRALTLPTMPTTSASGGMPASRRNFARRSGDGRMKSVSTGEVARKLGARSPSPGTWASRSVSPQNIVASA